jgi:hypothetical protein
MAIDRQKAAQFRNACAAFDVTNSDTITSLSNVLEQLTTDLAKNAVLRFVRIIVTSAYGLIRVDSEWV